MISCTTENKGDITTWTGKEYPDSISPRVHVVLKQSHMHWIGHLEQKRNLGQLTRAPDFMLATISPQRALGSLMIPVKSGKDGGLRSWGLPLWVQVDHDKSPLDQCLSPPRGERRRETGGDLRRFIWGKGKMKGDYGDPAREKPNKLTPKVLPWEDTNVCQAWLLPVQLPRLNQKCLLERVLISPSGDKLYPKNTISKIPPYYSIRILEFVVSFQSREIVGFSSPKTV